MRLTKWTRIMMAFVVLALAVGFSSGIAAERHLWVVVNGQKLDVPVRLVNGQVVGPIRPIAEALGADVHWRPHAGGLRIDSVFNVSQSVTIKGHEVWYDLPPEKVAITADQAIQIAREEWHISFPVTQVILTRVEREPLYCSGGQGPGPLERPIWLVFFNPPPNSFTVPIGPGPPPPDRDSWRSKLIRLHTVIVRVDAQTGKADSLQKQGTGWAFSPLEPHGPVIQRVFRSIPPEEYQTFWNFPRFDGTFFPARASANEPQERYSTDISRDGDRYRVSLTHAVGNEQTIWTFLVSEDGEVERGQL